MLGSRGHFRPLDREQICVQQTHNIYIYTNYKDDLLCLIRMQAQQAMQSERK